MLPSQLKESFLVSVTGHTEKLFHIGSAKAYTNQMFDKILPKFAEILKLEYVKEYNPGRVDFALLEENSDGFKRPIWIIEHENVGDKAHEEISKLVLLASPQKLLISYAWDNRENRDNLLKGWANIVHNMDMNNEVGENKNLYVILGSMNPYKSETLPDKFTDNVESAWEFYHYKNGSFCLIK